jgi:peptidyl-prolyl cis-trans isomerase B (cyclophilin B)
VRRRRLLPIALALLGGVPASRPAFAEDPVDDETLAHVEHRRAAVSGAGFELRLRQRALSRAAGGADPGLDVLAARAFGRIGTDRPETEGHLRAMLAERPLDARLIQAIGISGHRGLVPDLLRLLESDPPLRVPILDALGMLGDPRADGYAIAELKAKEPEVRVAACLALSRLGSDRGLESVIPLLDSKEPEVVKAACVAGWRIAGARRKARSTKEAVWEGDSALAQPFVRLMRAGDPETRIFALRAVNVLLPAGLPEDPTSEAIEEIGKDPDARVAADAVARFAGAPGHERTHRGGAIARLLLRTLEHDDPLVRETAADVCADRREPEIARRLAARVAVEPDPRVREHLAIALASCGDAATARAVLKRADRPPRPAALVTEAKVALAARDAEGFATLRGIVAPSDVEPTRYAAPPIVLEAVLEGLGDVDDPVALEIGRALLAHPDAVVRSGAASLVGDKGDASDVARLATALEASTERVGVDARIEIVKALGKLAKAAREGNEAAKAAAGDALARIRAALTDPAPTVRLAAREVETDVPSLADLPQAKAELLERNDWKGLPRPKQPVLGLDLTKGASPWLSESEILDLAKAIRAQDAGVVLTVEGLGDVALELDAEQCPVHAANLVLLATAGVYDGTTWHRVVPAFVIQGGDPRGDGSGDAGYSVPDEISTNRFTRGALGMPKNTKDTGGCQIFLMHCWAPHLDGRYTCFGRAISGLDVIDRVRVGDRIAKARVVAPIHAASAPTPTPQPR